MTITGLTALEALRQPIVLLITVAYIIFVALLPALITHTLDEGDRLIRDSALALHFVAGIALGGYAACSSLVKEIRRGTVLTILSKPINPDLLFLAKFTGIALVVLLFSALAMVTTLLSTRAATGDFMDWWALGPLLAVVPLAFFIAALQNYFSKRPFASGAIFFISCFMVGALLIACLVDAEGKRVAFAANVPWSIVPAGILITLATLVLTGLAAMLAPKWGVAPTLATGFAVLMIGLMSDYIFGRNADSFVLYKVLYYVIPNWQFFWMADALSGDGVPWNYVGHAALYALLYLAGLLCAGILIFRNMEIK